jgi:hypothetical protein
MEREFELELVDAALAGFFGDFEAARRRQPGERESTTAGCQSLIAYYVEQN